MPSEPLSGAPTSAGVYRSSSVSSPATGQEPSAGEMALDLARQYAREKPEVVALVALGVGFVLGWRLRSW